jgi:hypothetical protein
MASGDTGAEAGAGAAGETAATVPIRLVLRHPLLVTRSLLVAFFLGFLVRDVVRTVYGRFLAWKFEREFVAAQRRMIGCKHERIVVVDVGAGTMTDKCRDCWAIRVYGPPDLVWTPNSAPPL